MASREVGAQGAAGAVSQRMVRLKLPGLPTPLRAVATEVLSDHAMLEAELPWLELGSSISAELSPGHTRTGRVRWIGVDVPPNGGTRLRVSVELLDGGGVAEHPSEVAFFSRASEHMLPDSSAYIAMEVEERPRRRGRRLAVAAGILVGIALGGTAARHTAEISSLAHRALARIEGVAQPGPMQVEGEDGTAGGTVDGTGREAH